MITECPKCRTMQTVDFKQLDEETGIVCVGCQSILKLTIVAEIADLPKNISSPDLELAPDTESDSLKKDALDPTIEEVSEQGETLKEMSDNVPQYELETHPLEKTEDDRKKILVCVDGEATRELIQDLLAGGGYQLTDVPSGIAAFMSMKLERPDVALIDAGLTDMPGADLCSQIKEHSDLKETVIILIGSMFEKNAKYRRQAPPLCGAEDYIDRYHLQSELLLKIKHHLDARQEALKEPLTESTVNSLVSSSEVQADSSEIEKAERLARIIISDIALYNVEKVEEGIQRDCFYEVLKEEINEGRKLFKSRVPSSLMSSEYFEKAIESFIQREEVKHAKRETDLASVPAPDQKIEPEASAPSTEPPQKEEKEQNEVESAKRLARIIISDIIIYNEKKVEEGIRKGTFYAVLSEEIKEGRHLFESRVPETLHRRLDYFKEALDNFIKRRQVKENSEPEVSADSDQNLVEEGRSDTTQVAHLTAEAQSEDALLLEDPFSENGDSKAHENAKRLARIIVSDIVIYNERKVDVGVRTGRFFEVLKEEIHEGRRLYESRVPEKIRQDKNYFQQACDAFILKRKAAAA